MFKLLNSVHSIFSSCLSPVSLLSFPLLFFLLVVVVVLGGGDTLTPNFNPDPPTPNSAPSITDSGSIEGFSYNLSNQPREGLARNLIADIISSNSEFSSNNFQYPRDESITATYSNDDGFQGIYSYKGKTGSITSDVSIEVEFTSFIEPYLTGYIGQDRDIVIEGNNFGHIRLGVIDITNSGNFSENDISLSNSNGHPETGNIKGSFSNDGSTTNYPQFIAGEVKLKGFSTDFLDDFNSDNALTGVFVAEKD